MDLDIIIFDDNYGEEFDISRDVRHGSPGFRVARRVFKGEYEGESQVLMWDENYQFYPTLDEVLVAVETREFSKGVKAF